jgi:magnesium-transporting ATPase (P-type)
LKTIKELICENFDDVINRVLLAAALVSVVIGEIQHPGLKGLLEGTSIAVALTIIIVVTSTNNYLAERRLAALVALSDQ